ncbi:MAG: GIY-YIG nuclease family protein [Parcubacteria group bacterium]|nr:GIY-YIG nuclease family protein [Parcubacteria group bacterium]
MYYVYAIKSCLKNYIYVGLTNNPELRIRQHNEKKEKTTRLFTPFSVIFLRQCPTRTKARELEKYLKSGVGKAFLKTL